MAKPTYEQLERRVAELEKLLGSFIDKELDDEQHELFELAVLNNIAEAVASTMDLDELLEIVIDEVNKALLTEGAGVLLYDEGRNDLYWLQVRDARRMLNVERDDFRLPLDQSIAGWVYKHNKAARVNDTSKDPRYYPELTRRSGFDIKKVLQVPLNTREKTIGVLMAMNKIGGDFSEQDEVLANSMAGSIALAIENATVYEKLKNSRDDLEMLYQASMALATTLDLDHLLEVVIGQLNDAMETEAAGVLLYDERQDELYWREVQDEQDVLSKHATRLPLDKSISGRVFKSGEPALLNNPTSDPDFYTPFEEESGFRIRNEMIVPLNTREETIGVLVVINKKSGQFTEEDLHVCSSLAGVVALAVENALFFSELLTSYRELEDLNRVKSKMLNHLSHELRTPLAIIRGTLATMQKKLEDMGISDFDRALARMTRHVQSLNRLESQVESIMMTGYSWERRMITEFLDAALTLMDLQAERTPEIENASRVIRKWLETTFPIRQDELEKINIKEFSGPVLDYIRSLAQEVGRSVRLEFNFANDSEICIPGHALQAVIEGLVRNAIEATPDKGIVTVTGAREHDRYVLSVKDTGIGIPDRDKELILEGFYPVQDTENYSSGRPYSFNAGGKGMDLLRIRMFAELYGFDLAYTTKRCPHLKDADENLPGDAELCRHCESVDDCLQISGSEFTVRFRLADDDCSRPPAKRPPAITIH
jgi:GAF domain-containing protein